VDAEVLVAPFQKLVVAPPAEGLQCKHTPTSVLQVCASGGARLGAREHMPQLLVAPPA